MTTTIPARFLPARLADLAPEHYPRIPAWWPLQPVDRRMAESERTHLRRLRSQQEAVRGPYDGTTGEVQVGASGPPLVFVPVNAPGISYRLSVRESTRDTAVYRYDPSCPAHRGMMDAVARAFDEAGPEYVHAARAEDQTDHSSPVPQSFAPAEEW